MVKVTLQDEAAEAAQHLDDDKDFVDESDISDDEDLDDLDVYNETLAERLAALRDIVPPQYRSQLVDAAASAYSTVSSSLRFGGKALWVVTTSALLLGVPLSLSIVGEQQLLEMEKEMKVNQSTNDLLAPGAEGGFQQPVAAAQ